ncbi:hypothetical protein HaLaN_14650 [Haematococcus lacustris]|uniref:Uncharacterized protein n=1 Tax=Haematococcus lacustris TaxID=44745 RepID=A0A699Z8M3_HAELA|nr:hypothetical protein HaLaN_14650 [Haematococcus lacustris]
MVNSINSSSELLRCLELPWPIMKASWQSSCSPAVQVSAGAEHQGRVRG